MDIFSQILILGGRPNVRGVKPLHETVDAASVVSTTFILELSGLWVSFSPSTLLIRSEEVIDTGFYSVSAYCS